MYRDGDVTPLPLQVDARLRVIQIDTDMSVYTYIEI